MQKEFKTPLGRTFLRMEYDQINNWIYCNWIGYISLESAKTGTNALLELIKETHCPYLLNDNKELLGPFEKANDWIENEVLPKAFANGLRYMAHVLAPNIAGALSGQDLHRRLDVKIDMQLFGDMEKAKAWLRKHQHADAENQP